MEALFTFELALPVRADGALAMQPSLGRNSMHTLMSLL